MSLNKFVQHIEQSHVNNALNDKSGAKAEALKAIKILNQLVKTDKDSAENQLLSRYVLKYYEELNKSLFVSNKIPWLSCRSSRGGEAYYPVIDFGSGLSSNSTIFWENSKDDHQNENIFNDFAKDGDFKINSIQTNNWNNDKSNLMNLYQDLLANCSFVSSFLALVEVDFNIQSLISPSKEATKYIVTLHFNGCRRNVEVSNYLPTSSRADRNIIIKSFSDPKLYWPAFIEKAYLKVMGDGYYFKGSNMANDTYLLSGWLPQINTLKDGSKISDFSELWSLHRKGLVTLGLGTGKLSAYISSQLNLISQHDYLIESFNNDSIILKNPWIQADINKRYLKVTDLIHFDFFYINWKPPENLKVYQENFPYVRKEEMTIIDETQYSISCKEETWVLVERHLPVSENLWMKIFIYETNHKVVSPMNQKQHAFIETNNRLHSIKLVSGNYTIVISTTKSAKFSIKSYGSELFKSRYQYKFTQIFSGEWDINTCGGNWKMSSYIDNPQYDLEILETTIVSISLYSNLPINFHLFLSDKSKEGSKIRKFDQTKLISDEKYNLNLQSSEFELAPGSYKLLISNFDRQYGTYKFVINSSNTIMNNLIINRIPTTLSLYNLERTFSWNSQNRHKLYFSTIEINTTIIIRLNHFNDIFDEFGLCTEYRPALRASIFNATTKQPVLINEEFNDDVLYGLFVDVKLKEVGEYILLSERFELGEGKVVVRISSDKSIVTR
ncbi:RIM13 [Candida pseudojiufengensis]|uniref:RIM13 n=1 Tax=Candida pseudojiufengensis TaxID=497109 RepID=UPI002225B5D5|nr:RIM13 [Candida pseudojiufengensis]KAI5964220.1 RIM13 [Candida pseudojiufengensis]